MDLNEGLGKILVHQILHASNNACDNCVNNRIEPFRDGLINVSGRGCLPPECKPAVISLLSNPDSRLDQEVYIRELCASIPDLPIQRLINKGKISVDGINEIGFLVKEYKSGNTLHQVLTDREKLFICDKDFSQILNQLGKYLSMMHEIKLPAFGKIANHQIIGSSSNCSWIENYSDWIKKRLDAISLIPSQKLVGDLSAKEVQKLLPSLQQIINQQSGVLNQVQEARLVHHDFHFLNIIADNQPKWTITGILDTENATAGDPAIDLVSVESHLFLERKTYMDAFMRNKNYFCEGYASNNQIIVDYPQKRNLYHIPWSLSYFETIFNMEIDSHPITSQVQQYAESHFSILKGLANGYSLEEIGVPSLF